MARTAAVFDLDRTLLRGSSTPAFNQASFEAGLSGRVSFPGMGLFTLGYELLGETLPSMALARAAALASRDKPVSEVLRAAELAADRLERQVAGYVRPLLALHRDAGRVLVLATTTPADLVGPLAGRLGFDDVVATRYATHVTGDGVERYTGGLDGEFVWSTGKLRAVRRWSADHDVELSESWAYSDSVYDLPLLSAVRHPTAVNPDARLLVVASARRWPVLHLDAPAGVPKLLGVEPLDVVRLFANRWMFPYARFDIAGTDNVPRHGSVLVAANHRSYFDVAAYGLTVFEAGRRPRGLAKKELIDAPVIGPLFRAFGVIRVDRDTTEGGAQAYAEAEQALRAGELLIITPQGTIPRGEAFFDPVLRGRTGVARLSAATGSPVVPLSVWGTERVWPRSSRLPDVTAVVRPPTVRVRVGPPVAGLTGTDAEADTQTIMDAIAALLPPEARLPRIPTAEELARTMPPG
jgi:putative phosphoserine phosphatase / 1-acylglycerol-3-phosphate O-acyltransferase